MAVQWKVFSRIVYFGYFMHRVISYLFIFQFHSLCYAVYIYYIIFFIFKVVVEILFIVYNSKDVYFVRVPSFISIGAIRKENLLINVLQVSIIT